MPTMNGNETDRLIRTRDVFALTGYGRTTIYMMVKAGSFPAPVRVGSSMRFSLHEVVQWIEDRKNQRVAA